MQARAALAALGLLACAARADAAVIEGRISHPSKPGAAANLLVEALGLDPQEHTISRETQTDKDGHYRFADLPAPAAYLVRAKFGGLTFPGGSAGFRQGEEAKTTTLDFKVYDQSADPSQLQPERAAVGDREERGRLARAGERHRRESRRGRGAGAAVGADTDPRRPRRRPRRGSTPCSAGCPRERPWWATRSSCAGPVLPGDQGQSLQLEYDLEPTDGALATAIPVPTAVENLAVYVQDFGIEVDAGELHPARPARQDDLIYQAFIGFDIPAGTSLPLRIQPLPPAQPFPQALVAAARRARRRGAVLLRDRADRAPGARARRDARATPSPRARRRPRSPRRCTTWSTTSRPASCRPRTARGCARTCAARRWRRSRASGSAPTRPTRRLRH